VTLDLLFPNFAEIVRTPADVDALNQAILDLAVRGRLVAQDSGDEPVQVLIERLKSNKAQLESEGVLGRASQNSRLDRTRITHDLPDSWEWIAVSDAYYIERGITFPASAKEDSPRDGNIVCLRTANVQQEVDWEDLIYVDCGYVKSDRKMIRADDILISMANSYALVGKVSLVNGNPPITATFGGFIGAIRCFDGVLPKFAHVFFSSPQTQAMFRDTSSQTTNIANISLGSIYPLPFPLPPLAEQHRIVAKVDELFSHTRALAARLEQAQAQRRIVTAAALHRVDTAADTPALSAAWATVRAAFGDLFDEPQSVAALRQTILNLAVRGRLVAQDAEDEPASALLERIRRSQKGRMAKSHGRRSSDQDFSPHENGTLPTGWREIRFADIALMQSGYAFRSEWYEPSGIRLLRNVNVGHGTIDWSTPTHISIERRAEFANFEMRAGDIVISLDRPIISTGLKLARVEEDDLPSLLVQRVGRVHFHSPDHIAPEYVLIWFRSSWFIDSIDPGRSNGVPHISQKDVERVSFPLPPLAEQRRIVAKVDELMRLCDVLEAKLAGGEAARSQLAGAVLAGVVA